MPALYLSNDVIARRVPPLAARVGDVIGLRNGNREIRFVNLCFKTLDRVTGGAKDSIGPHDNVVRLVLKRCLDLARDGQGLDDDMMNTWIFGWMAVTSALR